MRSNARDLSLYVHIPFCKVKCAYCDFLSFGGCGDRLHRQYIDALCRELKDYRMIAEEYIVRTIFFGGGTPSYVDASLIGQALQTIREIFVVDEQAEITIEGNPDSLTEDKLTEYRRFGINRLSIGLQSMNDDMLKVLGRVHDTEQFLTAWHSARQAGFGNINIDLMSGLPGESVESYIHTLNRVARLEPEHISAYSLIVEDGTPLSRNEVLLQELPTEEEDRKQYTETGRLFEHAGYQRYEISNYAREGFACRHNLVYWTGGEYLGVGLGAASYLTICKDQMPYQKVRFRGVRELNRYIEKVWSHEEMRGDVLPVLYNFYEEVYILNRKDEIEEFMFLGLRLAQGIEKMAFRKRFGLDIQNVYGDVIEKYIKYGLLSETVERLALTEKGIDVSNVVLAEFIQ